MGVLTKFTINEIIKLGKKSCTCPMQELHVLMRYQKFVKPLQCYRNLDQLLIRSTCCYNVASYLTKLLYLLTQNEFMIIDSFDAANKIKSVPPEVFDGGYVCMYDNKLIATQLKKRSLKKPL